MDFIDFVSMIFGIGKNTIRDFKHEEFTNEERLIIDDYKQRFQSYDDDYLRKQLINANKLESRAMYELLKERQ